MKHRTARLLIMLAVSGLQALYTQGAAPFSEWLKQDRKDWDHFIQPSGKRSPENAGDLRVRAPAGERIFFVKKSIVQGVPMGDIYSMAPDGSDVRPAIAMTSKGFSADLPELSADGTKLVFISNYRSWLSAFYRDAFMVDMAKGTFRRITGDQRPAPAENFGTLSVTVDPTGVDIFDTKDVRISFKGCTDFVQLKDNTQVRVTGGEPIWVKAEYRSGVGCLRQVTVPAGGEETVTMLMSEGTLEAHYAAPSRDGSQLAVSTCVAGKQPYWSVSIWDTATGAPSLQHVGKLKEGGDGGAVFSPNGAWLTYCPGVAARNSLGLLATRALDSMPRLLFKTPLLGANLCMAPAWAPDSRNLLFLYGTTDTITYAVFNLYTTDVEGSTPVPLTNYAGGQMWAGKASYSPDGTSIVFTLSRRTADGKVLDDLYVMPAGGGPPEPLTDDGVSSNPCWGTVTVGQ